MSCSRWFLALACLVVVIQGHELDCDFTSDLCHWSNHPGDEDKQWSAEPSHSGDEGYLLFKPNWGSNDKVATLSSPMIEAPPSSKFHFSYWMVIGGTGALRFRLRSYFENGTLTEERTVFERTRTSLGEHSATIDITNVDGNFRILVDAVVGDGFYGVIHLKNFRFEATCDETWCKNGGSCVMLDDKFSFECRCAPGFSGKQCERYSSTYPLCEGIDVNVSAWPESITPYVSDSFGVKCSVANFAVPPASTVCGGSAAFRAVTSIVLKKENITTGEKTPIAMVSTYDPPTSYLGKGTIQLKGGVPFFETLPSGEIASLSAEWADPDESQAGLYACQVTGIDAMGHSWEGEVRSEVMVSPETLDSLRAKIVELQMEISRLEANTGSCQIRP